VETEVKKRFVKRQWKF